MLTEQQIKIEKLAARGLTVEFGETPRMNLLIMNPCGVLQNIARKSGVSTSDLRRQNPDILMQAILDTKKALTDSGVNVSALENFTSGKDVRKSNHIILVASLPYDVSEGDLAKAFGKFGSIDKIILAPTVALALVIFHEAAECYTAFESLVYSPFKGKPLFLEMAPINILSSYSKTESNDVKQELLEEKQRIPKPQTILVRNLNVKTSDKRLKRHFNANMKEGTVDRVDVSKEEIQGKEVSLGCGFIEFNSPETAENVCRDLQGTVLDGCNLELFLCHVDWEKILPAH